MKIEAEWMRGGTSKCWVFEAGHLQKTGAGLDALLPRLFGSPDPRQIDGVGGATSTTSKAVILHRADEDDEVDVEFTFAQVGIEEAVVDWGSNCGNCSAVVGLYALEKGWVVPTGEVTRIVTRNTNTGQIIVQRVPTPHAALPPAPVDEMPGVPFPGFRVGLGFLDPAGRTTGSLPTGSATDTITAGGTPLTVSMVDAGAPVVIVRAEELGLDAARYESWRPSVDLQLDTLEQVRRQAAVRMGLAPTIGGAARAIPKLAIVAAPTPADPTCDVNVMMLSMGRPHPALAITGSIALTLAARTPGTVLHEIAGDAVRDTLWLRTPAGVIETWSEEHGGTLLVGADRTARTIATATIHLPDAPGVAVPAAAGTIAGGVHHD